MTRKPLGRGLSALLTSSQPEAPVESQTLEIDIDLISPNPEQPRTNFDERGIEELAMSIRENGVVQPILVRRVGNRYELVAGERRFRAAQRATLTKIPA